MSKRDKSLYIEDIIDSAKAIKAFTQDLDFETFKIDRKTYSATIREYIVIGEAISKLIDMLEEQAPFYPWRMIKDFRNFIVHEYFGVDAQIIWDLTTQELDELLDEIAKIENGESK